MWLTDGLRSLAAATILIGCASAAAQPLPCQAGEGRFAETFGGKIAGLKDFKRALGAGWTFALIADPYGWNIRILDIRGVDLSQITPPYHAPNTRELFGWHFRNADNTGPNDGSVNAPQQLRPFFFAPSLSGTGGFRPPDTEPGSGEAFDSEGRGFVFIREFELADLDAGRKARMTRVTFDACVSWPNSYGPGVSAALTDGIRETFKACGLKEPLALDPFLDPALLTGDFDGDGGKDHAATISRGGDGKRAIAICRNGKTLDVLGLAGALDQLLPVYFDRMDYWRLDEKRSVPQEGPSGAPPVLRGDAITIGINDKSSVMIYWDGKRFWSQWQGD